MTLYREFVVIRVCWLNELPFLLIFVFMAVLEPISALFHGPPPLDVFLKNFTILFSLGGATWLFAHIFMRSMKLPLYEDYIYLKPITPTGYKTKRFKYAEITAAGIRGPFFVIVRKGLPHEVNEELMNRHPDYMYIPIGNYAKKDREKLNRFLESKGISVKNG